MTSRRRFLHLAAGAVALPPSRLASAQAAYPAKPISIVVPYAPGGPADTIARILGERLRVSLRQTIIIENTTGAGGTIAVARRADAGRLHHRHRPERLACRDRATYSKLPYDLLNDFQPLTSG